MQAEESHADSEASLLAALMNWMQASGIRNPRGRLEAHGMDPSKTFKFVLSAMRAKNIHGQESWPALHQIVEWCEQTGSKLPGREGAFAKLVSEARADTSTRHTAGKLARSMAHLYGTGRATAAHAADTAAPCIPQEDIRCEVPAAHPDIRCFICFANSRSETACDEPITPCGCACRGDDGFAHSS